MDYKDLKTFCDRRKILFPEFGEMVDPEHELTWKTYYKVISGFIKAGKRSGRKLDAFILAHRSEIESVLGRPVEMP